MAKAPSLQTPAEKLATLGTIEGVPVIATAITIPGAGGGLRDALTIEPVKLAFGERVWVLIEGTVKDLHFPEVGDTGARKRVHVLNEEAVTLVDGEFARKYLDEQARLIEEARGNLMLDLAGSERASLATQEHEAGMHAAERDLDFCPECQAEVAAEADEATAEATAEAPTDEPL